jgi:hypothetical protein
MQRALSGYGAEVRFWHRQHLPLVKGRLNIYRVCMEQVITMAGMHALVLLSLHVSSKRVAACS